jgi:uncharacterized protein (TIRG00374 family)
MEFLRRRLGLILRTLVSVALVAWLCRLVDWPRLAAITRTMDTGWLAASLCCFAPVILIVSWRWRLLLAVHDVHLRFWRVLELTMIGQFFSSFLMGTTGGDVFKIFYVARAVPQRRAAVGFTVIVDRIIGMVALLLFGVALSFTVLPLLLSRADTRVATLTFYFFAAAGTVGSIVACFGFTWLRNERLRGWLKRIPFLKRGSSLFAAYERTAHAYGVNGLALIVSIPSHVSSVLMGYCIIRAMHLHPALLVYCSIQVIVNMLIALPTSIAGLGVREGLFVMFFALLGIDADHAVAYSLTFFALNMAWGAIAGVFYFFYRHETHEPAPDPAEVAPILYKS